MRLHKRRILLAIAAFTTIYLAGCRPENKTAEATPIPVTVAVVEQYSGSEAVTYSASIVPYVQVPLAFKSAGYVTSILQRKGADGRIRNIQQGDWVKRDTVLATVRQDDYQHTVQQYTGQLEQATASATKAKEDFARADALYKVNALTQTDYDAAKAQLDSSQGTVTTAQAALNQAQQALEDCQLRAPMDSTVLSRNIELGALVAAGTQAFTVGDIHLVKAVFGVPDNLLAIIQLGKKQNVLTETYPQEFTGQITSISPQADQKSRTFQVEVTIPNEKGSLKSGMVATLDLGRSKLQRPVLVVPLSAIVSTSDGQKTFSVFVVTGEPGRQVAHKRSVQPGGAFGNKVEITSGVALGDRVISNGATLVLDGQSVRVIP
ncbi:MAG TPA: efflux RND transporter periplasmic adaptor subunit [Dongiaceae bacterium]|nr:efflux RND transporter periplasmic adaptor subunit [Dongiaceae bacterium]